MLYGNAVAVVMRTTDNAHKNDWATLSQKRAQKSPPPLTVVLVTEI